MNFSRNYFGLILVDTFFLVGPSINYVSKRIEVGGSKKLPVLLTLITAFMLTYLVGGSEKVQNYGDVI